MNVIKFRALKKRGEGFVYGYFWKSPDGSSYIKQDGEDIEVLEQTLGQYICLDDKNRKEIYKGDIVKYQNELWEIVYQNFCAGFTRERKTDNNVIISVFQSPVYDLENDIDEVIGNIYANINLLN